MPGLEAIGLSKRYGQHRWALRDVSLAIESGGITGLVGPNAAGKSTLIRTWLGFEKPTEGSVRVGGLDPQNNDRAALRQVGYVPQSAQVYRGLTAREHLGLFGMMRDGFDDELATAYLDQLAIPLTARGSQLSGGQQAQLILAAALGTRASILLLDEPLAHLDPLARREFLGVVRESVQADRTVLLSSHVVSDIEQACDAIVVLGAGRVLLQSSLADAIAAHAIASAIGQHNADVIAEFSGPDGDTLRLIGRPPSVESGERAPSLEEVVLGHIAAARGH